MVAIRRVRSIASWLYVMALLASLLLTSIALSHRWPLARTEDMEVDCIFRFLLLTIILWLLATVVYGVVLGILLIHKKLDDGGPREGAEHSSRNLTGRDLVEDLKRRRQAGPTDGLR